MQSKIKALQAEAQSLELSAEQRKDLLQKAVTYGEDFLESLPDQKAFVSSDPNFTGTSFSEGPDELDALLSYLTSEVDAKGLNPASGNHLGYIPGGGLYPSALGDYLAAITNRYAGVFFSSPGAVHIENKCLRWLCDLIGYDDKAGGNQMVFLH